MLDVKKIKKELVDLGRKLTDKGLVVGPGGNTSARLGNIIYMKASGITFEKATESDYIGVDLKTGEVVYGQKKPTCEILMHLECYLGREDISAVVHTHPPYAIAYAMLGKTLKQFTPDFVAVINSDVPTIKYVIPAGKELATEVSKTIKKYNAVLMANHGLLTVGTNLKEAYYRTLLVEDSCKTVISAQSLGRMRYFTKKEVDAVDNLEAEDYRRLLLKMKKIK